MKVLNSHAVLEVGNRREMVWNRPHISVEFFAELSHRSGEKETFQTFVSAILDPHQ